MVMSNNKIAEVKDDTLYQLSDVQTKFGIHSIDLIERASRPEEPAIKLCFLPNDVSKMYIVDTAFIWIDEVNNQRDNKLPTPHERDSPRVPEKQIIVALVLSPESCNKIRKIGSAQQSLFSHAYAILKEENKKISESVTLMRPLVDYYCDFDREDSSRLRFGLYHNRYGIKFSRRNGYQPPDSFSIQGNELKIYGSELKRFMEEVEAEVNTTMEQNNESKEDTYDEAQASLTTLLEEVEETKLSTPEVNSNNNKETGRSKAQALFRLLAAEIIKRAKENNVEPPGEEWPGLNEDIFAIAAAWAENKENGYLMTNSTTELVKYKRGIIACNGHKKESDYYLNLFPEYKDYIIQYRIDLAQKKAKSKKN